MLGMISTAKHNRIVAEKDAEKDAEIAGLMKRFDRLSDSWTLLLVDYKRVRTRLAPFTAPRARDDKGRFIKETVA